MSIWLHIVVFGMTGLLIYFGIFYGAPRMMNKGMPLIYAFWGFLWAPVFLLLPLSLFLFVALEGGTLSTESILERFRFTPLKGKDWLLVGGAVLVTTFSDQILEPVGKYFARKKAFAPPDYLPGPFNPLKKYSFPPREFFGVSLKGNWKLLFVFIPLHLFAMFSEEVMWRGYLLPQQELVLGSWAWVFNGLLWAWLVHAVLKWHFVGMLPGMLIAPLVAQYTQSTWASFIAHAVPNSLLWLLLLCGVLNIPAAAEEDKNW